MQVVCAIRHSACRAALPIVLAVTAAPATPAAPAPASGDGLPPFPMFTAGMVKRSLARALVELEAADCQALFRDFSDRDGRTLETKLRLQGTSPGQHLRRLRWLNGIRQPRCQDPAVLLVTRVGEERIYVCPQQFTALAEREPTKAAGLMLHEQLHALGLGEDPPTSAEISHQVWSRCGR